MGVTLLLLLHHLRPSMEFPHLSSTNNVPLEAEAQQIRGLVEAAGEEQTRVRAELAETREKEQQLSARDKELTRRIATLEGIVSSVRCIPPEILSHIFLLTTPSNDTNATAHCSNGPSLLRLSHICSRWRSIAHGTPKLWGVLQFKLMRYGPLNGEGVVSIILHFARLSQPHGMNLAFEIDVGYHQGMPLAALWSCSRHITSFKLHAPGSVLAPLIGLPTDAFPLLRSLDVALLDSSDAGLSGTIPAFHSLPHLQTLKLVQVAQSTTSGRRLLKSGPTAYNWAELRVLHLDLKSPFAIWDVYRGLAAASATKLERLHLCFNTHTYSYDTHLRRPGDLAAKVHLDNLLSLTLTLSCERDRSDWIAPFLDSLIAPRLVTLDLNGYFPLSTVSAFVSRLEMPTVTMTSLSLEKILMENNLPELLALFRSLSGVTHFALRGPTLQYGVLHALTLPASGNLNAGEIIFPALQHLELALGRYNETAIDVATVADLFESRLPAANAQGQGAILPGRCLVTAKLSSSGGSWREDEC